MMMIFFLVLFCFEGQGLGLGLQLRGVAVQTAGNCFEWEKYLSSPCIPGKTQYIKQFMPMFPVVAVSKTSSSHTGRKAAGGQSERVDCTLIFSKSSRQKITRQQALGNNFSPYVLAVLEDAKWWPVASQNPTIVLSVTQPAVHHKRKPSPWLPLNWVEARLLRPHESQKPLGGVLEPRRVVTVSHDEKLRGHWPFSPPAADHGQPGGEKRLDQIPARPLFLSAPSWPCNEGQVKTKEVEDTARLTSTRTVVLWLSLTDHNSETKRTEPTPGWMRQGAAVTGL